MEDITLILLLAAGLSLIFTLFVTPRVVKVAHALKLYDLPDDERKIHKLPIPRLGGMMFLPIMLVTMTIIVVVLMRLGMYERLCSNLSMEHWMAFIAGGMMLFSIGLFDDIDGGICYKCHEPH